MKAYPSYKDSGFEFIGEIPEHWNVISLKHLLKGGNDGIRIGPFGSSLKLEIIKEDGYKVYGQGNVINDDFQWGHRHIDEDKFRELSVYEICPDDVIITMMGTTGKAKVVPDNIKRGIFDSHIIRVRVNNKTFSQYVSMLINDSYYVYHQVKNNSKGSIMEGLNSSIVKALQIVLPPLPEQQTIVDFLDRKTAQIDTLIEKKQLQIELLHEQRAAFINHAVTKGLNPDVRMKDSGVEWLGEIPSHWEVKMLKWIAYLQRGHDLPSDIRVDGEFPIISSAGNSGYHNDYKAKAPGVVTGRYGTIGEVHFVDQDYWPLNTTLYVKDFYGNDVRYIFYLLKILPFKAFSEKSAVPGVDRKDLHELPLGCPPVGEQEAIANHLDKTNEKISQAENKITQEIALLREYRTALISEAVTGKIDVRENNHG